METIDASVILKWFISETGDETRRARIIRDRYLEGSIKLVVPDFVFVEVGNVLTVALKLNMTDITAVWELLEAYNIPSVVTDRSLVKKAMQVSRTYGISVYDAVYVATAINRNAKLVTADKRLVNAVGTKYSRVL